MAASRGLRGARCRRRGLGHRRRRRSLVNGARAGLGHDHAPRRRSRRRRRLRRHGLRWLQEVAAHWRRQPRSQAALGRAEAMAAEAPGAGAALEPERRSSAGAGGRTSAPGPQACAIPGAAGRRTDFHTRRQGAWRPLVRPAAWPRWRGGGGGATTIRGSWRGWGTIRRGAGGGGVGIRCMDTWVRPGLDAAQIWPGLTLLVPDGGCAGAGAGLAAVAT